LAVSAAIRAFGTGLREVVGAGPATSVLLTGPADPDGDSIGACLGLAWALRRLGLKKTPVRNCPRI